MEYIRRTLEEELRRRSFGGKDLWETLWMTENLIQDWNYCCFNSLILFLCRFSHWQNTECDEKPISLAISECLIP